MDNYTTTVTEHSVTIVIDSTNKSAIRAIVRAYFGDNISEEDLNKNGSYTTGGPYQKPTVIGAEKGLIGGLLDKLPPELRRAGRDVVNTIRTRVPIGAVTGGKVFPPLF